MSVDRRRREGAVICAALAAVVCLVATNPPAGQAGRAPMDRSDVSFGYRGHVPVIRAKFILMRGDEALLNARGVRLRFHASPLLRQRVAALAREVNEGRPNTADGVVLRSRDRRTHRFGSTFSLPIAYLGNAPTRVPLATRRDQRLASFLKARVRRNLRARVIVRYARRGPTGRSGLTVFTDRRAVATRRSGRCRTRAGAELGNRRVQRLRTRIAHAVRRERVTSRVGQPDQDVLDFAGGGVLRFRARDALRIDSPPRARETALVRSLARLTRTLLRETEARQTECDT